ncbi:MAG: deoxyribonuclease IV [bacterium]|nr:deoxyribonuclease IV [bacterium]
MSLIGAHVSGAGSLDLAPDNAKLLGCEVFQFFSRSPRGGPSRPITKEIADLFKGKTKEYGMESYIHAPYYINFASGNDRISHGSAATIREELERGTALGVKHVMTHLGSSKDLGKDEAIKQTIERIKEIYKKPEKWTTKLLLENSAGAGGVVGARFEELGQIIDGVSEDIGICLDSCHMFASGYAIRTSEEIANTLKEFKKYLALDKIKLLHANDSKFELGEFKDRHDDIGNGKLGINTFKNLMANKTFSKINWILETPGGEERQTQDLELLKKMRNNI